MLADSGVVDVTVTTVLAGFMTFVLRYLMELRKLDARVHEQYVAALQQNARAIEAQTRALEAHSAQLDRLMQSWADQPRGPMQGL